MGFWEQMNRKNAGCRNQHNKSCISDIGTEHNKDDSCESKLTLETLLAQWDMCDIELDHPEWFQDPEFVRGFALVQIMNMDAFEAFCNAISKGNVLAIVALGDFCYRLFEFYTKGKRYRFGTEAFPDGLIKGAMSAYALAMMHEPYFEKMTERLSIFKLNFAREEEFMSVLEEIGDKLNDLSFDHPEELRKLFSL